MLLAPVVLKALTTRAPGLARATVSPAESVCPTASSKTAVRGVGGVNDDLAGERTEGLDGRSHRVPGHRQHDHLAGIRRGVERDDGGTLAPQIRRFAVVRIAH